MTDKAYLVLSDGSVFPGYGFGALEGGGEQSFGEVVFCTSMTGYQEMLTDPSFAGQIVVPTYPLQGNYGINDENIESKQIQVAGFVVREQSSTPSHYNSEGTLHEYLAGQSVPGIWGVDTRAITMRIRSTGVMMGAITAGDPQAALRQLKERPAYDSVNFVERVTVDTGYAWNGEGSRRIAVVDCGVKYNILRLLADRDCQVSVLPATATADEVLALNPDGVVFSPGPGDPVHNGLTVETAKAIIDRVPTLGICLGHQIIARALGAGTYKLKFGHRGANHPVQDLSTGKVYITAQNHGYAVADEALPPEIVVTHRNLHDGTIEGIRHRYRPVLTIQYHSEASPGPLDNEYIFDEFMGLLSQKSK
ncbi:MAG: glutamine-hydrolyzing carbamoyl-phosphate synthase small subunit [Chloroflexi bacterium]|nr:glutamine-hydrolyzing carbamoyl-phosphate synthase small subunit [Chloroflexota bacterium]